MKIIKCGKLIDGTGKSPIENAVIVIEGSKIVEVGEESLIDTPRNSVEINCSKNTVLPGLIDTHLHFALGPGENYEEQFKWPDGIQLASGIVNARFTLESGVTTGRDLGARNRVAIDLRDSSNMILAPRILVCGRSITMTGGHFHYCNAEADGYEGVKKITRQLLKEGVDFIKIMASGGGTKGTRREYASYSTEEIEGSVEAAHELGKKVTAHCHATKAIENAVEAGVDIIEHCSFAEPEGKGIKHVFQEDIAEEIVKKGIYVDNVLSFSQHRLESGFENFIGFRKMGAKILPGTDGLRLYNTANMAYMLEMMVRGGATPMQAIQSATKMSAEACGIDDVVGTIEVGKEADLLIIEGDPIEKIHSLRNPKLVIKNGTVIPPSGRNEAKVEFNKLVQNLSVTLDKLGYRI